jgi:adenylate cyclase
VRDQVRDKVDFAFEDLGNQQVKNIARPVRVYRMSRRAGDWARAAASSEVPATQALALPDRPSIAVLPFVNLSGNSEQEYLADGMVEEIITALSRIKWLFVIARNSSFTYKGRAVDIRQVGRELGRALCPRGQCTRRSQSRSHYRSASRLDERGASVG